MSTTGHATSRAERRARADYTGGVYGSMLASSVIIGAGAPGPYPRLELVLLLLLTGLVFWIAHVHAQLFGARLAHRGLDRRVVLEVCRDEWPIVKAAVPRRPPSRSARSSASMCRAPSGWRSRWPSRDRWAGRRPRPAGPTPRGG